MGKKNTPTNVDRLVKKFIPHKPRVELSDTDDDKPRRVSDETAATARKEPTGSSSEERAKSLKLMRSDQRVKCRYTEVILTYLNLTFSLPHALCLVGHP